MVSGTVVNSVTGEPIGHALVQVFGVAQRAVFTDSEGHFAMDGLPAGQTSFDVRKPGYFSRQQLGGRGVGDVVVVGPSTVVTLKLVPQGAMYGRITDAAGQPIEYVPVRLAEQIVRDGRQHQEMRNTVESDEDGRFRLANLAPGTYYVAAGPGQMEMRLVIRDEKPKTGYPMVYYPGVPDLASATPIQLTAGQQAQADFSLATVPVYHVSGTVGGFAADQGVLLQVLDPSGEQIQVPSQLHQDTGTFEINAIPAGSYVLKASSQIGDQALRAQARLNVAANLDNVQLALGPALSIPVVAHMESRDASNLSRPGWSQERPPVTVRLIPADRRLAPDLSPSFVRTGPGHDVMVLADVEPGKYTADITAWGPWYVQSAEYGPTNLLADDLTAAPGQANPIEIVLRDDGATLTGTVKSADKIADSATVLAVPQPFSRRHAVMVPFFSAQGFTMHGLAPGEYLVFAFDHADRIEYANPDALQPYASQATHVTLSAGQETQIALSLIRTGEGD